MRVIVRGALALVVAVVGVGLLPSAPSSAPAPQRVTSADTTVAVTGQQDVALRAGTTHVALSWQGSHEAALSIAFSDDGMAFGQPLPVVHDDSGADDGVSEAHDETTEIVRSGVLWTGGARYARLTSDTPIAQLTLTSLQAGSSAQVGPAFAAAAAVDQPPIISRAAWGANESWRFNEDGTEKWPAQFFPVQKLIVHHTAGRNNDPDPAGTVRSIHYYNAITRGWGDIGYNFLIDEAGRIYEGRYSRDYGPDEIPSGTDTNGHGVQGAHVANYNSGTVGIALLGHLVDQDATPAARAALEWLLAWLAERHGIDPLGEGLYVNPHPEGTTQKHNLNISGHGEWTPTKCPGATFFATMPELRQRVAARIAGEPPPAEPPAATVPGAPELTAATAPKRRGVRLRWSVPHDGGSPITGYRMLRLKNGRWVRVATLGPSATTWRDRYTRRGRTYTYVVRAVNAVGRGPLSNQASAPAR